MGFGKCILTVVCSLLFSGLSRLEAVEIQGVSLPSEVILSGRSLSLNGAGLRTFRLLMVPIKVYVAALYAPTPLRSAEAVESTPGPLRFDFTFLRAVAKEDVAKAWDAQFAQSVAYTYSGYSGERDRFIGMFGALPVGGVERVEFVGNDTVITDCGRVRGTIPGRDFQKAFLSLWFGPKPVSHKLRDRLLGVIPPA